MSEVVNTASSGPLGFTGVNWETRRPEKLRADLTAGVGPGPLHACAQEWADFATELDRLVAVTRRTVTALCDQWESPGAVTAAGVLTRMPVWLDALAHRVRRQADLVAGAAAAAQTAHLAMPAAAEIDQVRGKLAEVAATAALVVVMTGGLARAERAQTEIAATAARVMHGYERDCTGVATAPPQSSPAPALVRGAASTRTTHTGTGSSDATGTAPLGVAGLAAVPPRVLGRFQAVSVGATGSTADRRQDPVTPIAQTSGGADRARGSSMGPVAPVAAAPGAGSARAGATDHGVALTHEAADSDTAEPMTWAQLAVHDQVRATPGPATTDPGHTAV
ncbi:PPE domain-containing protein [uncultured Gordonia sp.]|uniref:PPE domain-containing protein n=2 Tax=Gordonia sp. (in: high G+C Gram-positive bacteria) TaxID=84139 RepID=UPI002639ED2B|nr:PPE domain-containing protein [uncultured Gordonia sp.]HNP58996.1 PPE domain-containing protein [Gordonia sp. (in: high G+C Gram-positive bacteria)]